MLELISLHSSAKFSQYLKKYGNAKRKLLCLSAASSTMMSYFQYRGFTFNAAGVLPSLVTGY